MRDLIIGVYIAGMGFDLGSCCFLGRSVEDLVEGIVGVGLLVGCELGIEVVGVDRIAAVVGHIGVVDHIVEADRIGVGRIAVVDHTVVADHIVVAEVVVVFLQR